MSSMAELIAIPLKKPTDVELVKPLQNYFKSTFAVTSEEKDYTENILEFGKLRKNALWRAFEKCESSLEVIYRYYDQICVLEEKLPSNEIQIPFKWKDAFDRTIFGGKLSLSISSLAYEKVCVLFNIAALQSSVALTQSLDSDEGLKSAAKLLQQSAGIFNYLKSNIMSTIQQELTPDMSPETLEALSLLMLAQAQEIFTFKAIHDQMKDLIIAKLAACTEDLYNETLKLFQKDIFRTFWDKEWIPLISCKQFGYRGLAEYFQSCVCKSNKSVGEEIARLEFAVEMFKTSQTKSTKVVFFQDYLDKASRQLVNVKKDNDFIYHERIPDIKLVPSISKANVAKLLPLPDKMSSNFQDIFNEVLPLSIYQTLSKFELRKKEIVNSEILKLRNMRQLLNGILASLNLPAAIEDTSGTEVPQSLKEKAQSVKDYGGVENLEKVMNELPELLQRNKDILNEAEKLLNEEEEADNRLRVQFKEKWTRLPSAKLAEQFKLNAQKYHGILNNAINADRVVRDKFNVHREAIRILSSDFGVLSDFIPLGNGIKENHVVTELRKLMKEVGEIKARQDSIENELNSVNIDMRSQLLSSLGKDGIIHEDNVIAENINTHYGPLQTQISECLQRQEELINLIQVAHVQFSREQSTCGSSREQTLCQLAAAYDAFKEIKNNLHEGIKFYNDLTQLLITFQNKISDFCFARKTEKEELLKDLTNSLSQRDVGQSINIPAHHTGTLPEPQNPVPTSSLPYPTQNQSYMPLPYGSMVFANHPSYVPPPLPAAYNPYATIPQPYQGGIMEQSLYHHPYYTLPAQHRNPPDQNL